MVTAGRRSRKTLIGTRKVLYRALERANQHFFHAAPTWQQAKAIFWEPVKRNTRAFWAGPPNETELKVTLMNGSTISVESLDRAYRLEGRPWHGMHITETANVNNLKVVWESNLRWLLADTKGFAILDGVPDMFSKSASDYREMARHACSGSIPDPRPMVGAFAESLDDLDKETGSPLWAFYTWQAADVVADAEIENMRKSMDPRMFRQEAEGAFEVVSGLVYYAYKAEYAPSGNLDKDIVYDPNLPVYIGWDFNIVPMSVVCAQLRVLDCVDPKTGKLSKQECLCFYKGYYFRAESNTEGVADRIIADHPKAKTFFVVHCQSGDARQTSAKKGYTDRRYIVEAFRKAGKTMHPMRPRGGKNPLVKDRVAATNSLLYHGRVRINPDDAGLHEWIRDLEFLVWKEGTAEIDLSDKMRGHISAAADYLIEKKFPVLQPRLEDMALPTVIG